VRISSDDRSLELPPSPWFSSSAEKHFFHFVIRAKPSCIPRAKPKCAPRAEPKCGTVTIIPPRLGLLYPERSRVPRAEPRGGTVTMMPPQWGYCTPSEAEGWDCTPDSRLGFARRTVFERSRGACYISRILPVVLRYFSASR